jgi:thioredoxin 1
MGLTTKTVRGDNAERILLLVHGLGADEQDLAALVPHLDPDGHFLAVLPRGPYSAPPGYAWYRMDSPELAMSTLTSSLDALDEVLDEACDQHGFPREQAIVGGFSQGGSMVLGLTFRPGGKPKPAGVLVMSGFLPPLAEELGLADAPPVLFQHGSRDPLIPSERAKEGAKVLADAGVPVVFREYPMEHQVTLDSIRDAADWLGQVRDGERPSGIFVEVVSEPEAQSEAEDDGSLVRSVGSRNFDAEVLRSEKPVIVDFWAPWCQPCRAVHPIVEQIAAMRQGSYKVVKVNIDENPDLAQTYQVQSIPLVALFRNGRLERSSLGAKPRPQLEAELGMLVIP